MPLFIPFRDALKPITVLCLSVYTISDGLGFRVLEIRVSGCGSSMDLNSVGSNPVREFRVREDSGFVVFGVRSLVLVDEPDLGLDSASFLQKKVRSSSFLKELE